MVAPPLQRLYQRTVITDSGCFLWQGCRTTGGYGLVKCPDSRIPKYTHRLSYEAWRGPIPDGYEIDHLCRVRHCWRPSHLEAVTPQQNMRRSMHRSAVTIRTGLCHRGHSMNDAYVYPAHGKRECRPCRLARMKAWRENNA